MVGGELSAVQNTPSKKPVGIFFSGGIDSTLLVYNALNEGREVYLFYANGTQSPIKKVAEEHARYQIKETLAKMKLPGRIVSDRMIDITGGIRAPVNAWAMTFYWFMSATQAIDLRLEMEEIQLGVIWGDELWGVMGFLETAWTNLLRATFPTTPANLLPKLRAPLAYWTKLNVRAALPEKLLKLTWYCEMPRWIRNKPKACGGCLPCLKRAMDDRIIRDERPVHEHIEKDLPRFEAFKKGLSVEAERILTVPKSKRVKPAKQIL